MGIIERIEVDGATLARLAENARRHGRSVEEEAAEALRIGTLPVSREYIADQLRVVAAMTPKGVVQTDSAQLLREDRDR